MLDAEFAEAEELGGMDDQLQKEELVDRIVVLKLLDYSDDVPTKFGTGQRATVELLVCDGSRAGTHVESWTAFGLLARDMSRAPLGKSVAALVITGDSQFGTKWVGLETRLTPSQLAVARKAVQLHVAGKDLPF